MMFGFKMSSEEELDYQRKKQANPHYKRELLHWKTVDGVSVPTDPAQWTQAYELAASLNKTNLRKLIGGYGGERGSVFMDNKALDLAADTLYNASFGIDVLTGAPLDFKHNAGHLYAFNKHGNGLTRPEQDKVNKVVKHFDGIKKLNILDDNLERLAAASLYAKHPKDMTKLLEWLPSSSRETKGWSPQLNKMIADCERWHIPINNV